MKNRKAKLIANKSGGTAGAGGVTFRVTLPTNWIKELGLDEENRDISLSLENSSIIIKKSEGSKVKNKGIILKEWKRVLISCWYGEVFVDAPVNTKKEDIINEARGYFQEKEGRAIIDLPNLTYKTESAWRKDLHKAMDIGEEWKFKEIPVIEIAE